MPIIYYTSCFIGKCISPFRPSFRPLVGADATAKTAKASLLRAVGFLSPNLRRASLRRVMKIVFMAYVTFLKELTHFIDDEVTHQWQKTDKNSHVLYRPGSFLRISKLGQEIKCSNHPLHRITLRILNIEDPTRGSMRAFHRWNIF